MLGLNIKENFISINLEVGTVIHYLVLEQDRQDRVQCNWVTVY